MKKTLCLIMAVVFVLALFAGCAGKTDDTKTTSSDKTGTTSTPIPSSAASASATQKSSDNYAVGKYKTDSDGHPTAKYEYALPLSTAGEKFSEWTVCYTPQYLPEEGYDGLGMYKGMQDMTGVDIEYQLVSADTRSQNFSVLVNSDALCDIMGQGSYFWTSGTLQSSVDDGYFANIYNYKEYLPNYLYEIYSRAKTDKNITNTVFLKKDMWVGMYGLFQTPLLNTGYMLRQDFMDQLNLGSAHDVKTYDQLHKVLTAFKTGKVGGSSFWPMMMYDTIELATLNWCGFNTGAYTKQLQYLRVVDGKAQMCGTTDDDLALFKMLNQWWKEGLIDPNWTSYASTNSAIGTNQANDNLGCAVMTPSTVKGDEAACVNPKCKWEPTPRLRQTEDQIIHWGYSGGSVNYGSASFSAKCEDLPLLMTFMDWQYSDAGALWTNWGPEGELWNYDSNGNRMLTDFALKHQAGTAWLQDCYCYNELGDAGIQIWTRNYAYPGGDRFVNMFKVWDASSYFDGSYVWPTGVKLTDEQSQTVKTNITDASTYYTENITRFLTGDAPFSDWDSYVKAMMDMGLSKAMETYQAGYDAYMKTAVLFCLQT